MGAILPRPASFCEHPVDLHYTQVLEKLKPLQGHRACDSGSLGVFGRMQ
jgi:hypothetical protein